ncbi:hypothetical protein Godav_013625 [Gossypium davidsonii]|uniref:Transmembrane protein n=2 Tax=Gossypium TaxID=3633 RepID=A0A7J8RIE0_GOSDV|nr:hypothetical protein [Gossypium davidsonii]
MNSRKVSTLFIILVISLPILSHVVVEGTRVLPEDFAKANHLHTYSSSVYEKAKFTMSCWLQRLASGPSPRGPGHYEPTLGRLELEDSEENYSGEALIIDE